MKSKKKLSKIVRPKPSNPLKKSQTKVLLLDSKASEAQIKEKRAAEEHERFSMLTDALYTRDPTEARERESRYILKYIDEREHTAEVHCTLRTHPRYAAMPPVKRTDLFADFYGTAYEAVPGAVHSKSYDLYEGLEYASAQTLVDMWKARQFADAFGITYEDYVALTFIAHAKRGAKHPPTPRQMHTLATVDMAIDLYMKGESH